MAGAVECPFPDAGALSGSDLLRREDIALHRAGWDTFTDLAVRDTIKNALRNVRAAVTRVEDALAYLELRRDQLVGRSDESTG